MSTWKERSEEGKFLHVTKPRDPCRRHKRARKYHFANISTGLGGESQVDAQTSKGRLEE